MKYLAALLSLVLVVTVAHAEKAPPAPSSAPKSDILKTIGVFQKDPITPAGFKAGEKVMAFAKTSPQVSVSISHATVPWYKGKDETDADTRHILLTAYVAGNIAAQLKSGKRQDEIYAGWLQVLATYGQLLRINSAAKVSEVDNLLKKQTEGTLQSYAGEVASGR